MSSKYVYIVVISDPGRAVESTVYGFSQDIHALAWAKEQTRHMVDVDEWEGERLTPHMLADNWLYSADYRSTPSSNFWENVRVQRLTINAELEGTDYAP